MINKIILINNKYRKRMNNNSKKTIINLIIITRITIVNIEDSSSNNYKIQMKIMISNFDKLK